MGNPKLHLVNRILEHRKTRRRKFILPGSLPDRTKPKEDSRSFEKGTEFEEFVVKLFNPDYFTLIEWRSDKNVDGIFPIMSKFPDLEFYFESNTESLQFAVECKWREHFFADGIQFKKNHLENYRHYEKEMQVPTFIVYGIGNTPSHPRMVYILPLRDITKEYLHEFEIEIYSRVRPQENFFLDCRRLILR